MDAGLWRNHLEPGLSGYRQIYAMTAEQKELCPLYKEIVQPELRAIKQVQATRSCGCHKAKIGTLERDLGKRRIARPLTGAITRMSSIWSSLDRKLR